MDNWTHANFFFGRMGISFPRICDYRSTAGYTPDVINFKTVCQSDAGDVESYRLVSERREEHLTSWRRVANVA